MFQSTASWSFQQIERCYEYYSLYRGLPPFNRVGHILESQGIILQIFGTYTFILVVKFHVVWLVCPWYIQCHSWTGLFSKGGWHYYLLCLLLGIPLIWIDSNISSDTRIALTKSWRCCWSINEVENSKNLNI